jgi:membrane protein
MATGVGDALAHLPSFLHKTSELLGEGWERASVLVAFGSISCAGLAVFYRLAVGHPSTVRRRVWPGTLIAHVLWIAVSWVFGEYVRTMAHYAVFYGSLATVAVALLWLYLTSLALLTGAEVNAQLEQEADRHGPFGIPARTSDATY